MTPPSLTREALHLEQAELQPCPCHPTHQIPMNRPLPSPQRVPAQLGTFLQVHLQSSGLCRAVLPTPTPNPEPARGLLVPCGTRVRPGPRLWRHTAVPGSAQTCSASRSPQPPDGHERVSIGHLRTRPIHAAQHSRAQLRHSNLQSARDLMHSAKRPARRPGPAWASAPVRMVREPAPPARCRARPAAQRSKTSRGPCDHVMHPSLVSRSPPPKATPPPPGPGDAGGPRHTREDLAGCCDCICWSIARWNRSSSCKHRERERVSQQTARRRMLMPSEV